MFCVLHRKTQNIAMCSLHVKGVFTFLFLHVMMSLGERNLSSDANINNTCVNTTWCSHSYGQVYKSLAKAENNFNISNALYPGRSKPASVRVLVSVFGSHNTSTSKPALYTWSMSCLFVSVPAAVLEFLSLGSILVTPRTQELIIHIPQFCCNVSESRENEILTRALAELQDLAISPGIQDPRLNTAECVIQGHQPNIDATGVNSYIRAILYSSLVSVILIGPILGLFSLNVLENYSTKKVKFCKYNIKGCAKRQGYGAPAQEPINEHINILCVACYEVEDPFVRSAEYTCFLLLLTDILITLIVVRDVLFHHTEIYIPILLITCICEGVVIGLVQCCAVLCCGFCEDSKETSLFRRFVVMTSANIIVYHLIWLIVGIMVNPTWGLTVLAVACFVIVALFCTIYVICNASKESFCHSFCVSIAIFVGLCLVVSLAVLAGQSFYGKETTGEILKTALLYVVGGLTWLFGKGFLGSSSNKDSATQIDNEIELRDMNNGASNPDGEGMGLVITRPGRS